MPAMPDKVAHGHSRAEHRQVVYRSPRWLLCTRHPLAPPTSTHWPNHHIKAKSLSNLPPSDAPLMWEILKPPRPSLDPAPPRSPLPLHQNHSKIPAPSAIKLWCDPLFKINFK